MTEAPPIVVAKNLRGLYPANPEAERIIHSMKAGERCEIKIVKQKGNQARMALYWIVLEKVAPVLTDMCQGDPLTDRTPHKVLKDRAGLVKTTILPSGDVVKDYDSISFAKMPEMERAQYVDWAFSTLAKWIGCDVADMLDAA